MMWEGLFQEISSQEAGRYWPIDSFPQKDELGIYAGKRGWGGVLNVVEGGKTFRIDSRDRTSRRDHLPVSAFAVIIEFASTCT